VLDEPLTDSSFLICASITRTTGNGSGIEDNGSTAFFIQTGMHVLNPAPISRGFSGETGPGGEAVEFVGVIVSFGEPVLIPHGIGNDPVEGAEFAPLIAEFGVLESITYFDLTFHVMNNHVHVGHSPSFSDVFLAIEF
jgi:hypothetical protein